MSILKVARLGHPVLREKARDLTQEELASPEIKRLIADMIETMAEYGGIGLAAPQVHHPIRLALIDLQEEEGSTLTVVINPKMTVLDAETQGFWEGCLSVPEMRGLVYRPRKVQIDFVDLSGKPRQLVAEGFLATVYQHELDHLDGVLYVDKLHDTRKFAFMEEYQRYWAPAESDDVGELED
jgi:peptide deformylase